jgi:hypothetical protein
MTCLGATLKYTERIYLPGADDFEIFKETQETQIISPFDPRYLAAANDLWHTANARVNARLYHERERLKKEQSAVVLDDNEAHSLDDIDDYFTKFGKGSHLLEYDFVADTPEPLTYRKADGNLSIYQCWTHKHTKFSVKRYATPNGLSVDSGRLSKYLKKIKESVYPLAYARAQKILALNDNADIHRDEVEGSVVVLDRKGLLKQQVCSLFFSYFFFIRFLTCVFFNCRLKQYFLQLSLVLQLSLSKGFLQNVLQDTLIHYTTHPIA